MGSLQLLDAVGLTADLANKRVLLSHLKPLVHSSCSSRLRQFALLSLAICSRCWSKNLHLSPSSNARLEVTYKDRREAFRDFSTRSRGVEYNY